VLAWKDYLPDLKGALTSFYEEKVQPALESKTNEFKTLVQENMQRGANTQKSLVAIALGILLLLALAFFWKDGEGVQWKYLALGGLLSYLGCYITALKPKNSAKS
jgi:hypothetical protein